MRAALFRCLTRAFFSLSTSLLLHEPPYEALLPLLYAAPHVSAASVVEGTTVDTRADACGSFTVIAAHEHQAALHEIALAHLRSSPEREMEMEALDSLVHAVLPHVRAPGGRTPTLDECLYYGCVMERGAYFPSLHWDTDWNMFPDADGFQLWYLIESHSREGEGNMFLARTPELTGEDPPVRFVSGAGGRVRKVLNKCLASEATLKEYERLDDVALGVHYMALQPGECLIFSQRTLHMSDPRPHLRKEPVNRLALNVRVILRDHTAAVRFCSDHPYCYLTPLHRALRKRATSDDQGTKSLDVTRHEMLSFDGRHLNSAPASPAGRSWSCC